MINEQETRIGNWIDTPDGYREVMSVYRGNTVGVRTFPKEIAPSEAHWSFTFAECNPIKITSSNSAGFNVEKLKNIIEVLQIVRSEPLIIPEVFYLVMKLAGRLAIKIEYVHQLQNLYLDITQEYLEWNPGNQRSKLVAV